MAALEAKFTKEKVMIVHRERGFIDRTFFDLWATNLLFPEIELQRTYFGDEALAKHVILHWQPPYINNTGLDADTLFTTA